MISESAFVAHTFTDTEIDRLRQRDCNARHAQANTRRRNRRNSRAMMCAYYVSTPISSCGETVSSLLPVVSITTAAYSPQLVALYHLERCQWPCSNGGE